jgi:hypothetical protein
MERLFMKKYKTILLDIDSLTYFLSQIHHQEREIYEQTIKQGIISLKDFKVIGLAKRRSSYTKKFIRHLDNSNFTLITQEEVNAQVYNEIYLKKLIEILKLEKEELLLVTGEFRMLQSAKILGIDQCFLSIFSTDNFSNLATFNINKIEELNNYLQNDCQEEEIIKREKNYKYIYINPEVIELLKSKNILITNNLEINQEILLSDYTIDKNDWLVVTTNPEEAYKMNKNQIATCFINNYSNDIFNFTPEYEIYKNNIDSDLPKLLTLIKKN